MTTDGTDGQPPEFEQKVQELAQRSGQLLGRVFGSVKQKTAEALEQPAVRRAKDAAIEAVVQFDAAVGPTAERQSEHAEVFVRNAVDEVYTILRGLPQAVREAKSLEDFADTIQTNRQDRASALVEQYATSVYTAIQKNDTYAIERLVRDYFLSKNNLLGNLTGYATSERAAIAGAIALDEPQAAATLVKDTWKSVDVHAAIGIALYAHNTALGRDAEASLEYGMRIGDANNTPLPKPAAKLYSALAWQAGKRDLALHTKLLTPHIDDEDIATQLLTIMTWDHALNRAMGQDTLSTIPPITPIANETDALAIIVPKEHQYT